MAARLEATAAGLTRAVLGLARAVPARLASAPLPKRAAAAQRADAERECDRLAGHLASGPAPPFPAPLRPPHRQAAGLTGSSSPGRARWPGLAPHPAVRRAPRRAAGPRDARGRRAGSGAARG